ncbi:MAG: hypothetical protein KF760_14925 [Candidatus Eremiobacteraeota bacterium]|nr:hypothetical protein [Candidatus Eremiobacteraeota bacterium]MCW5866333.1 hypothetical protein [Candidatus Eremiobacteraeota bacterium]
MKRAMTLAEVLVAGALSLVLLGVGLVLLRRLGSASLSGSSQLQLQLTTRETLRKIVPMLKLATAPNSQQTAIYTPDIGATAANVVFCSPEDLLNPNPPAFNPRDPFYILLQIRYAADKRQILLEDFYAPERYTVLGHQVSDFQVARTQRIGLRLQMERQATIRDSRGFPKPIKFQLSDSLQLPE